MPQMHRPFQRLAATKGLWLALAALACVASASTIRPAGALEAEIQAKPEGKTPSLADRIEAAGFTRGAPAYLRIFKEEATLEVWMRKGDRFELFQTYPVCKYDGTLGPKLAEGDRQSPEGFYTVSPAQLRWTGRWYRGFDLSFPNAYDVDQGRTGSAILIHGGCASIGCYAMTNPVVDELFEIATEAFDAGQARIAVQVFPFRMTAENMARHQGEAWVSFWTSLKPAYDRFETDRVPARVSVCKSEYRIESGGAAYDGSAAVARSCDPATTLAATAAISPVLSDKARSDMGPLRTYLEEIRKLTPLAQYPGATKAKSRRIRLSGGVPIRCNLRLASCRKWAALHRRAKPRPTSTAAAGKRRTAIATP